MRKEKNISAKNAIDKLGENLSDTLIDDINKSIGKIAYALGEQEAPNSIKDFVSSGSTLLDTIITNGAYGDKAGFPVGRLSLITGDTSSGKSLVAAHVLINCQRMGGIPIIFDEESTIDIPLLQRLGVKIGDDALKANQQKLVYLQGGTVEKVLESMEAIISKIRDTNSDKLIVIVWDSIASTPTKVEIEGEYDLEGYGMEKAKLLSKATRKLTSIIASHKVLLLWTNQIRVNVGAIGWGDKTSEPGGKAAPFHSTIRIRLAKLADIKNEDKETIGVTIKATTKKNKIAPYNRSCEFNIYFNKGIDDIESWLDNLVAKKIVKRPTTQKYSIEVDEKEYEFKKTEWTKIIADNNLYDSVRKMVIKANTIDYSTFTPSYDDLVQAAKTMKENDEENEVLED